MEWMPLADAPADWLSRLGWLRLDLLGRLLLAALLGGAVGLERELSRKPAGFRTNLLICLGAALLTELSIAIARSAGPAAPNVDPGRIAAQIVSGIGFLGAGTIIQARGSVVGLTTAATLWVVAAIGMAVGMQAYVEAVGTTVLVIVALILLGRVEDQLVRRSVEHMLQVSVTPQPGTVQGVEKLLVESGFQVHTLEVDKRGDAYIISLAAAGPARKWHEALHRLLEAPAVTKVSQL